MSNWIFGRDSICEDLVDFFPECSDFSILICFVHAWKTRLWAKWMTLFLPQRMRVQCSNLMPRLWETLKPHDFSGSSSQRLIFNFSARSWNWRLLHKSPRQAMWPKKNAKSYCAFSSDWTIFSPIYITKKSVQGKTKL